MYALIGGRMAMLRLAVLLGFCATGVQAAMAAGVGSQVQELLETAWKPSSENFATAHQQFDQAKAAAPADMRVPLAMALVCVKNYKNDEAAKYIDQAIPAATSAGSAKKIDPLGISARRLKIWLQVLRKDHAGAQAGMHELAAILAAEDSVAPSEEAKRTAEWLGGVLGYYAGPASAQTPPVNVDALQNDLTKQMNGALANTMADGKAAALKEFERLQGEQATARADIKARLAAKRADELKKTQTAQTALAEKMKNLESGKATEGKAKPDDKGTLKLREDLTKLEQTIAMEEGNPRRNERALQSLKMRRTAMMQQMSRMANSTETAAQQEEAKKEAAEAEKKKLQGLAGTLEAKTKQLSSGSDSAVSTPIDAKLNSLSSYAPIDLEKEKQRILDSYAAK